ncbi:unnamed protein product [Schistosoma margrebowiei]|uniref:Uncharacterized protein n=1 Tax=Schistosoma margrebowiei TaxID=48269 RepID=A0A183MGQ2_9TREM|nr:unnamed protein product [Schistosoma margrebowiei]
MHLRVDVHSRTRTQYRSIQTLSHYPLVQVIPNYTQS